VVLKYKGYTGQVEIDYDIRLLCGCVIDIKDVVTFKGVTLDEAQQAFQDSIDDYLEFCAELEVEPDRPFSGKLPFRTSPEHHRKIYLAATQAGKSINAWMDEVLVDAAQRTLSSQV